MDPFVVKVILSLIIGILWVLISTYIAEKVSGRIGGLILGLPSTAVVSLLFIGLTQGMSASLISSMTMTFSSGLYCFFYISYILFSRRGFTIGIIGSLIIWFLFASLSSIIAPHTILLSGFFWLLLIFICICWTMKNIHINHTIIPKRIISSPLWFKATMTGMVISVIVIISKLAGPKWGGIFGTFPALATSTFLITVRSGGIEFTRLIAKNILISTTTTIGLFAILSYLCIPFLGVIFGIIVAYIGLLLISIPLYFFVIDKLKD